MPCVDTLLLDKTGTITLGNRHATEFLPVQGVTERELAEAAQLSSLSDETPEGRSIVVLAKEKYDLRQPEVANQAARFVPFAAQTRMSGVDIGGVQIRKGAVDAVLRHVAALRGTGQVKMPELEALAERIAKAGGTPLAVVRGDRVLGIVHLKDIIKGGIRDRFAELRRMGIRTVMITGDNPLTAAAIAAEAGVDDFLAQATPEDKLNLIRKEQAILSAIIFNALIIIALIPLALKGVTYRARSAASQLSRNLLIYGIGGLVVPFAGIKLIDMAVTAPGLA